jgi:hypothetical protein
MHLSIDQFEILLHQLVGLLRARRQSFLKPFRIGAQPTQTVKLIPRIWADESFSEDILRLSYVSSYDVAGVDDKLARIYASIYTTSQY